MFSFTARSSINLQQIYHADGYMWLDLFIIVLPVNIIFWRIYTNELLSYKLCPNHAEFMIELATIYMQYPSSEVNNFAVYRDSGYNCKSNIQRKLWWLYYKFSGKFKGLIYVNFWCRICFSKLFAKSLVKSRSMMFLLLEYSYSYWLQVQNVVC